MVNSKEQQVDFFSSSAIVEDTLQTLGGGGGSTDNGGSTYFDGSGDYIETPHHLILQCLQEIFQLNVGLNLILILVLIIPPMLICGKLQSKSLCNSLTMDFYILQTLL